MDNLLPTGASTGEPLNRVDGRLKVTGQARYAAEHAVPGCVLVCSAVARGRIKRLDTAAAELTAANGFVQASGKKARRLSYGEVLKQHQLPALEVTLKAEESPEMKNYSGKSFCASFVEVQVHPLTRQVRVSRVVSVVDAGRVLNAKTARSQVLGSVVWGIGMALMEDARLDHRYGRFVNHDLAEYHVPVNADVPEITVEFIDQPDPVLDPIGAKGLGEIGLVGFAAAVANAVYHATGRRVRELPITPDKLFDRTT